MWGGDVPLSPGEVWAGCCDPPHIFKNCGLKWDIFGEHFLRSGKRGTSWGDITQCPLPKYATGLKRGCDVAIMFETVPRYSRHETTTARRTTILWPSYRRYSEHAVQVEALEKAASVEGNSRKITELETELEIAGSEVQRLQRSLEEMEEWKEKLVKESMHPTSTHTHTFCLYDIRTSGVVSLCGNTDIIDW